MRRGAELRGRDDVIHRRQLRLPHRIDQRELDLGAVFAQRPHRSHHHRVSAARAKIRRSHVLGADRPRRNAGIVHQPEETAARQIAADDARNAERPVGFVLERDNGDRNRGAGAADDLDVELRARGGDREKRERDECQDGSSEAIQMDLGGFRWTFAS